jgi:2-methylcitrate dehydratase PrpD
VSTVVEEFAAFAVRCRTGLPDEVAGDAVGRILDVVGNCLAARELTAADEPHNAINRIMRARGGAAESSVLTGAGRLPGPSAAMVNGTLAHALDFDDTHLPSVLHPSASIVPAALAVAEAERRSGPELLAAVVAGIEVCNRVGLAGYVPALRDSSFFRRGLHATSICGTLGAAVAAALLYGLDDAGVGAALSISTSMGAGIIEANRTGGSVKRIHCGWAAQAGVEAAQFARAGITGPPTAFEGGFGFLPAYLGTDYVLDGLVEKLGQRWETLRTVYKPYPSNHFTHPVIDSALALRAEGVSTDHIESITVGVADTVIRTIGEPRELKIRPTTAYHAKFSAPYTVATALLGGGGLGVYLDDFSESAFRDPARLALAEKVTVVPDAICADEFPTAFSAIVTIRCDDGTVRSHRTHSSRGGPGHPLTLDELQTKFELNAQRSVSVEQARVVAERIRALPTTAVVAPLLDPPTEHDGEWTEQPSVRQTRRA